MLAKDSIAIEGKIIAVLPGTMFRVELTNKQVVLGHISGKMRETLYPIDDWRSRQDGDVPL